MSPRGLAENEFHVVKRDGASTSRPIDIPPRSGLAKAPANARKCSPGRFQFLSRVLSRGKIRSILENLRQSCDRFRSLLAFTAKYRLVRTGSGVERGREGFRGWENSLLERILFFFFFFEFLCLVDVVDSLKRGLIFDETYYISVKYLWIGIYENIIIL